MRIRALGTSVGLSALFLVVYGGCNWITAHRTHVGTIAFAWEHHIPFVPLMIAPYLSIDLFFVAAPFLCRSERELTTFAKRIAAAIVVAGICFLLFPLRFVFGRPQASGWIGSAFDWFRAMDAPFNQFPSLHIALCSILVVTYGRHTRGMLRGAVVAWFVLIAASAVLTYQHHVLDLVGGFAVAGYCFYVIPETTADIEPTTNPRVGSYYLVGALLCGMAALLLWPLGSILLWPAFSLALVAAAYFRFGAAVYRKSSGLLPWSTIWSLGPCLLGQHISRWSYRRRCRAWDAVAQNVWIGSALSTREANVAVAAGVSAVLDLTAEFSAPKSFRRLRYCNIPVLDLTAPTPQQLDEIVSFIAEEARRGIVYVHCKIGYSRSAVAAGAYLIANGHTADEAIAILRHARPSIVIRPEALAVIHALEAAHAIEFVLASAEQRPV
ncbi:MAG: phosphatase PAP2/dual specificity phosphatase family protein [Chthoniobacterales bacterium]